jgi:hypothetical protein
MQSKEKCTSVGQGPYMEPSEDFNECCCNSTGEDFKTLNVSICLLTFWML